jgi:hypothetical protein
MRPVLLTLALLLAGCARMQNPARRGEDVSHTIEVRLPADAYTPLAQALPTLHEIAWRMCGNRYRIIDRHMDFGIEAVPTYNPSIRVVRPNYQHAYTIIGTIECLRARQAILTPEEAQLR